MTVYLGSGRVAHDKEVVSGAVPGALKGGALEGGETVDNGDERRLLDEVANDIKRDVVQGVYGHIADGVGAEIACRGEGAEAVVARCSVAGQVPGGKVGHGVLDRMVDGVVLGHSGVAADVADESSVGSSSGE